MKIVCISDTHAKHDLVKVPEGDVLLHAGDFTKVGDLKDVFSFATWLRGLPHKYKIVIAGNHDFCFDDERYNIAKQAIEDAGAVYLQDTNTVVEEGKIGLKVHGTPWQPWFHDWAFNLKTEIEMKEKWDMIPFDADILIVHGPPSGWHDETEGGVSVGSTTLRAWVEENKPRIVVCGHIHEDRGVTRIGHDDGSETLVVNASCVTRRMRMQSDGPFVFETSDGVDFKESLGFLGIRS